MRRFGEDPSEFFICGFLLHMMAGTMLASGRFAPSEDPRKLSHRRLGGMEELEFPLERLALAPPHPAQRMLPHLAAAVALANPGGFHAPELGEVSDENQRWAAAGGFPQAHETLEYIHRQLAHLLDDHALELGHDLELERSTTSEGSRRPRPRP